MVLTCCDGKTRNLTHGHYVSRKTVVKTPADGIVQFAITLRYPQDTQREKIRK